MHAELAGGQRGEQQVAAAQPPLGDRRGRLGDAAAPVDRGAQRRDVAGVDRGQLDLALAAAARGLDVHADGRRTRAAAGRGRCRSPGRGRAGRRCTFSDTHAGPQRIPRPTTDQRVVIQPTTPIATATTAPIRP